MITFSIIRSRYLRIAFIGFFDVLLFIRLFKNKNKKWLTLLHWFHSWSQLLLFLQGNNAFINEYNNIKQDYLIEELWIANTNHWIIYCIERSTAIIVIQEIRRREGATVNNNWVFVIFWVFRLMDIEIELNFVLIYIYIFS